MFERYTEEARKAVFFARYEASSFGSDVIETEHLLLGILRADPELAKRLLPFHVTAEAVRARMEKDRPVRESVSTSVDLPIGAASKRAMAYGAEDAERLGQRQITTGHLLWGIVREEECPGARILREAGLTLARVREVAGINQAPAGTGAGAGPQGSLSLETARRATPEVAAEFFRDLTEAAESGELAPLIGRETELARVTQILSRRTRNNAALIGESGVGKTAIVEGLAQRIADGAIPLFADQRVFVADAISLFPAKPNPLAQRRVDEMLDRLTGEGNAVLCIEGLFDLAAARSGRAVTEAMNLLSLSHGAVRCIATGTPEGLRATVDRSATLARHFEVIGVAAPDPAEAVNILQGSKARYEQFHGVSFGEGAIEMAVFASGRFLAHRALPDRALDLMDEAAARVKLRLETEPLEMVEVRRRIRQHVRGEEQAIASHDHAAARQHAEGERAERENLRLLLEQREARGLPEKTVTPEDVEQVVADRAGVPVSAVRTILGQKGPRELEQTMKRLGEVVPIAANGWVALLAAHIVRSSDEEVEALVAAIRAARAG